MNPGLCIAAIPSKDSAAWKISSEQVPHLTLMITDFVPDFDELLKYVEHACNTSLTSFGLNVDRRGTLGDKEADVLFFGSACIQRIREFRNHLLSYPPLRTAYDSVEQYEGWTPHLTLGYPESPAKEDPRDDPYLGWVNFDKIAIWNEDYVGPEIELRSGNDLEDVAAMSEPPTSFLSHYGIKGMRWGIRRKNPSGGQPSSDSEVAAAARKKLQTKGVDSLSNAELRALLERADLEARYSRSVPASGTQRASKFIAEVLVGVGKQQASKLVSDLAAKQVGALLKRTL